MDEGLDLPAIYNPPNADEVWVIRTKYSFRTLFFSLWVLEFSALINNNNDNNNNDNNNKRRRRRKGQFKYQLVFAEMPKNDGTYIYTMIQLQYL